MEREDDEEDAGADEDDADAEEDDEAEQPCAVSSTDLQNKANAARQSLENELSAMRRYADAAISVAVDSDPRVSAEAPEPYAVCEATDGGEPVVLVALRVVPERAAVALPAPGAYTRAGLMRLFGAQWRRTGDGGLRRMHVRLPATVFAPVFAERWLDDIETTQGPATTQARLFGPGSMLRAAELAALVVAHEGHDDGPAFSDRMLCVLRGATTTDVSEAQRVGGVEYARAVLRYELLNLPTRPARLLRDDVDVRHINLLVDSMTWSPRALGVEPSHAVFHREDVLSRSALQVRASELARLAVSSAEAANTSAMAAFVTGRVPSGYDLSQLSVYKKTL